MYMYVTCIDHACLQSSVNMHAPCLLQLFKQACDMQVKKTCYMHVASYPGARRGWSEGGEKTAPGIYCLRMRD